MSTDRTDLSHHPDHPEDAIAAYALGVLDADERAGLEAHLAGCAACRAELERHEAVVGALGFTAAPVAPGTGLRASLLAEIRQADSAAAPAPRRFGLPTIALAAAAIVAIVSIAVLAILLARTMDERNDARVAEQEIAEYLASGGTLSPLVPAADAAADVQPGHGSLAVGPSQDQAMLVVHGLAPSGGGRRYMAWAERNGDRVRLGEVRVNDQGVGWLVLTAPEPMSAYDIVGINRFLPDAPEGEPFLVATIQQS